MGVQVRVEGAGGVVGEQRRRNIAGKAVALPAADPDPGRGKASNSRRADPTAWS